MNRLYTVLVVDDEPHVTDALVTLLQQQTQVALDVYAAYRGRQALETLQRSRIDLLVTDIRMPDLSGLALIQTVNERWPACRTLILTGYADFQYAHEAIRQHVTGYVLKSANDEALLAEIFRALRLVEQDLNQRGLLARAGAALPPDASLAPLLRGEAGPERGAALLRALGYGLPGAPLYLVGAFPACGRLEEGLAAPTDAILRHYLGNRLAQCRLFRHGNQEWLWLLQFDGPQQPMWINGLLETVQASLRMTLGIAMDFIVSSPLGGPEQLAAASAAIRARREASPPEGIPSVCSLQEGESTHNPSRGIVEFIRGYIAQHIEENLTLMQLACACGYNADYLARVFKQATGETIGQNIAARKLRLIASHMRDATLSIDAICQKTGFTSRSYFNRFLKRETGMNPRAYRAWLHGLPDWPEDG